MKIVSYFGMARIAEQGERPQTDAVRVSLVHSKVVDADDHAVVLEQDGLDYHIDVADYKIGHQHMTPAQRVAVQREAYEIHGRYTGPAGEKGHGKTLACIANDRGDTGTIDILGTVVESGGER